MSSYFINGYNIFMDELIKTVYATVIVGVFIGLFACADSFKYEKEKWFKDMIKIIITFAIIGVGVHLLGGYGDSNENGMTNMPGRWSDFK